MEKPSFASDSGGAAPYNTVFVDTSLDTHLALIVSDTDTVSDLKKKILYEHPLCFPNIGGIDIHALKVKRRGHFYHLSDSMFVKSAFDGICKSWFLSVDASSPQERLENQHSGNIESGNLVACFGITNNSLANEIGRRTDVPAKRLSDVDDPSLPRVQRDWHAKEKPFADFNPDINCNVLSLDTNNRSDPELQEKHESDSNKNKNKDPIMRAVCDEANFRNVVNDAQFSVSLDGGAKTGSATKKNRKTKKRREDKSLDHALKENDASTEGPDKDVSWQNIVVPDNSLVSEDRVLTHDMVMASKSLADKPCWISSPDTNKRPGGEVQMTNVLSNGTTVPGNHVECEKDNSMNDIVNVQCHVSMEEASPGPTKKKQKTLNSKNSSEENRVLCDSTNDTSGPGFTISQCSLVDKQTGMSVTVDHLSSEILKDGHLLTSSPSTGRRKRKKKSSNVANQEVTSVPNSAENDKVESPGNAVGGHYKDSERELVGPVVQGAMISEPCLISVKDKLSVPVQEVGESNTVPHSLDVDMSTTDAGNAESTNDPPEAAASVKGMSILDDCHTMEAEGNLPVAVQEGNDLKDSGVTVEPGKSSKKRKKSKKTQDPVTVAQVRSGTEDHRTVEAEGNPPVAVQEGNDLSKDTRVTKHGNVKVNDCQKFRSDQTARVEEERELSQNNDPKAMPSAKCAPLSRDEIDMNSKIVVSSDVLDTNDIGEHGKSSKKKKKSRRTQDPVTVPQVTSGTEHKTSSVIGISSTERHEIVPNDHLSDKSRKEEGILFPSGKNEESKAKTVNAPTLATDRETDSVIQNVLESLQDLSKNSESAENKVGKSRRKTKRKQSSSAKSIPELQTEDANVSCKNVKLATDGSRELEVDASSILTKTTEHQLSGSNWKPGNDAGVETGTLHTQLNVNSSHILSYKPEGYNVESPLQGKNQPEAVISSMVLVDKITITTGPDNKVEAGKYQKKFDVHSSHPSPDFQSSMKINENKGSREKAQAFNSSTVEPQSSLSKGEGDNLKHHRKLKLSEVSGTGTKAPPPSSNKSDKFNSKAKEATSLNIVNASRMNLRSNKNKETTAASNSSLESFKSMIPQSERVKRHQSQVAVGEKFSNNKIGEVLNSSERKKSLLATSGTIFKDDNDWSSDDDDNEDGVDNSDTSTRTPSDNSLSSDYSDGDSSAPRNGSYIPKRKQRGRNISKSHSSLNLDTILRSSSRYKAAKLTASQSQPLDFESQPEEFVPESQANP
ncbi:hypothetical protein ACOSQ2_018870 [Xanthoceras sorbifolium]